MDRLWVYQSKQTPGIVLSKAALARADARRMFNPNDDEVFEDTDVNPELDSFHYMEVLLESLRLMNQIPAVITVSCWKVRFSFVWRL